MYIVIHSFIFMNKSSFVNLYSSEYSSSSLFFFKIKMHEHSLFPTCNQRNFLVFVNWMNTHSVILFMLNFQIFTWKNVFYLCIVFSQWLKFYNFMYFAHLCIEYNLCSWFLPGMLLKLHIRKIMFRNNWIKSIFLLCDLASIYLFLSKSVLLYKSAISKLYCYAIQIKVRNFSETAAYIHKNIRYSKVVMCC